MSIIDNAAHSVQPFVSGKSKAFTGQRLAQVSYKTISDKTNPLFGVKRESKCVSVPMITAHEILVNMDALVPSVIEYMQTVQDKIIRNRVDNNAASISAEEISITACIEYLESQDSESGNRLTKESVGAWFAQEIEESLTVLLADKLGVSDTPSAHELAQIKKVLETFKDKVSSLAGGKTSYEPNLCVQLKKVIALAPEGDALKSRFNARLDKMIAASKENNSLLDCL